MHILCLQLDWRCTRVMNQCCTFQGPSIDLPYATLKFVAATRSLWGPMREVRNASKVSPSDCGDAQ
jgi:hypothetical protein